MTTLLNYLPAMQQTMTVCLSGALGTAGDTNSTLTIDGETFYVKEGIGSARMICDRGANPAAHRSGAVVTYAAGGGGAGGVSVTDGVTTVPVATSLSFPSGAVTDQGAGSAGIGGLLVAQASLTNANIKALGSGTVVDVVGAPGAGKVLVPFLAFITVNAVAAPYTGINAAATIQLAYHGGSDASVVLTSNQLTSLFGLDGEVTYATLASRSDNTGAGAVYDASEGENLPLGLSGWNGGDGNFTGGNAANSGRVKVFYTIENLP